MHSLLASLEQACAALVAIKRMEGEGDDELAILVEAEERLERLIEETSKLKRRRRGKQDEYEPKDEELKIKRRTKRKMSLMGTANPAFMKENIEGMPESMMKEKGNGWVDADKESVEDLADSFHAAIVNSSPNVENDIGIWFDKSWPTKGVSETGCQNMKIFFFLHAKDMRVLVKMSRIGVAFKIGLTLLFSYSDLITDALVFWSYVSAERTGLAYGSGFCIGVSLLIQAITTFQQYKVRERETQPND